MNRSAGCWSRFSENHYHIYAISFSEKDQVGCSHLDNFEQLFSCFHHKATSNNVSQSLEISGIRSVRLWRCSETPDPWNLQRKAVCLTDWENCSKKRTLTLAMARSTCFNGPRMQVPFGRDSASLRFSLSDLVLLSKLALQLKRRNELSKRFGVRCFGSTLCWSVGLFFSGWTGWRRYFWTASKSGPSLIQELTHSWKASLMNSASWTRFSKE